MSSRAGSHAGRGFRYQDAVAVWAAIGCWSNRLSYGAVIPEGGDDIEFVANDFSAFVQVKSRREHLGLFPVAIVVTFIKELWERYDNSEIKPSSLILVLERSINNYLLSSGKGQIHVIDADDRIGKQLAKDSRCVDLLSATQIKILPSPREEATRELTATLDCPDMEAWVYFGALAESIGTLSDQNGLLGPGTFKQLSVSDVQNQIDVLRKNISLESMEQALQDGICDSIDFLTPFDDPEFYLGVDTQPGHIAAGLVAERPTARKRTIDAIELRRNVLVTGPSGSGKSSLMWETAGAIRHAVRWFRIRRLSSEHIPLLIRICKAYRANLYSPVGFIFDDIGNGLAEGWDALSLEAVYEPGIVMLGSVREEDLFTLHESHRAIEVREMGDDELAERLWNELRRREYTEWQGWKEPWQQSKGLLLEYVHLLTQGRRLVDILGSQVANRVRDEDRHIELVILRIVSSIGIAGASVDVDLLTSCLKESPEIISKALRRLLDEHLIKNVAVDRLGSLHQIRALELFKLCHEVPPPYEESTISIALKCVAAEDLVSFIKRILLLNPVWLDLIVDGVAKRINEKPDAIVAANSLSGLGLLHIYSCVDAWLEKPEVRALPRTQVTIAATLSFSQDSISSLPLNPDLLNASKSLSIIRGDATRNDPRKQIFNKLNPETVISLLKQDISVENLNSLLSSMVGAPLSNSLLRQLLEIQPNILSSGLISVARLLGSARLIDIKVAVKWVDGVGQQVLLDRVANEIPWVSKPVIFQEDEVIASCNVRYVAPSKQVDVHEEVVNLCELLLDIVPMAEIAASDAIGVDGELVGYGDYHIASKRIPRENLPTPALPDWNRQWRSAVADRIAAPSYTDYLSRANALLEELVPLLNQFFNEIFKKKKVNNDRFIAFDKIRAEAEKLTPPKISPYEAFGEGSKIIEQSVTSLQSVIFDCCSSLITRFYELPKGATAFLAWVIELRNRLENAIRNEPWAICNYRPESTLDTLSKLLEDIRLIIGESGKQNVIPYKVWHKPKAQKNNAFRVVTVLVRSMVERRVQKVKALISKKINELSPEITSYFRIKIEDVTEWPPLEILVTIPIVKIEEWPVVVDRYAEDIRMIVGEDRNLLMVPTVNEVAIESRAVGGVKTLFPKSGDAKIWLENEKIHQIDEICFAAFNKIIDPLTEVVSINRFDYGAEGRPQIEVDALSEASERFNEAKNELCEILTEHDSDLLDEIMQYFDKILRNEIDIAQNISKLMNAHIDNNVIKLIAINNLMTEVDLYRAGVMSEIDR